MSNHFLKNVFLFKKNSRDLTCFYFLIKHYLHEIIYLEILVIQIVHSRQIINKCNKIGELLKVAIF